MKLVATVVAALTASACIASDDHGDESVLFEQAHEDNADDSKADATDCSGVRVPDRSGFRKRVALTFDDGPNPVTTPLVMDVLRAHNAPATFFTNGSRYNTPAAKALAAEIAGDELFILANHSQGHKNLAQQPASVVSTEISRTDALIRATGVTPTYFRFPFGSSTCETMRIARDYQYIVTGWHVDSADWCFAAGGGTCKPSTFKYVPDAMRSDMLAYVLSQVRATNGGIVLFHDIHPNTANNLDAILTALEAEGFELVRLDDRGAFPRLHAARPM